MGSKIQAMLLHIQYIISQKDRQPSSRVILSIRKDDVRAKFLAGGHLISACEAQECIR